MKAAIFRPKIYERKSREYLKKQGFDPISIPLVEPEPTGCRPLSNADYLIFTSVNGVRFAFKQADLEADELSKSTICAIGPKTAQGLEKQGLRASIIPKNYSSKGLVDTLTPLVYEKRVEVARSSQGSKTLLKGLNQAGAFVHETVLYRLKRPRIEKKLVKEVLEKADLFLFTSSLIVRTFLDIIPDQEKAVKILNQRQVGAIGDPTRQRLKNYGIKVGITPPRSTFSSLVKEASKLLSSKKRPAS